MATLEERIAEAATELTKGIKPLGEGKEVEGEEQQQEEQEQEQSGGEDDEQQESSQTDDLDEEESKEALKLYKILKDPTNGPLVLEALAKKAGLLGKNTPETKTEVKEAKKAIVDILAEKLGPEAKFLAPKIGEALEEIFANEREEQQEKFQQLETEKVQNQVIAATERLARETKGESKKFEARMNELALELLPSPEMSVDRYLRMLYTLASGKAAGNNKVSNIAANRIRQNANNVSERLRTSTSTGDKDDWVPKGKVGLKGAINAAIEQLAKQR
jgi:hypothetical protein